MSEKPLDQTNKPDAPETEMVVNEYGETRDPAVVVDEPDRTVLLTSEETIVIDKEPRIDIVPTNRPRKVYGGMWGQPELITAGLAIMAVLVVALIYIFLVIPANRELEQNSAERNRLQAELLSATAKYGMIEDTETAVSSLMTSQRDFEATFLPVAASGRAALYERINSLILANNLVNTSGPDYAPLELADEMQGVDTEQERGRAKYRSIYPGVYVTMTVDGSYHNIRRFIRDIETGRDFVIVSAVELEPSETDRTRPETQQPGPSQQQQTMTQPNTNPNPNLPRQPSYARPPGAGFNNPPGFNNYANPTATAPVQGSRSKGKMHGEVVSLRLELAAYFRRTNPVSVETQVQ